MTAARSGPAFSVQDIPFSTHGSWFDISPVVAEKTYAEDLHLVSHQNGMHAVLRLVPLDPATGDRADTRVETTPGLLSWTGASGRIDLAYESPDTVRLRGSGLGIGVEAAAQTLTPFSGTYFFRDPAADAHVFTSYETGRRYRVTVLSGTVTDIGTQTLGGGPRGITLNAEANGPWEIAIEELDTARPPYASPATFDTITESARSSFAEFVDQVAPWRSSATPAAELAAYVVWSATVRPTGLVTRPGVLMSKHWMDKVWSWDHCFNALALAPGCPDLALDQFALPFDHQDDSGALPDSVTHSEVLYNFVKPPIHGWTFGHLRRRLPTPPAGWNAGRASGSPPGEPPAPTCPTTSTATTAAGTTPPPSTPRESSKAPTWRPSSSSSCANWPPWPPHWTGRTRRSAGRKLPRRHRRHCWTNSGTPTDSWPGRSTPGTPGAAPASST